MSQFQDKNICLVLSCDRPYYRKRRESNYDTYRWFQQNGFSVVFLFAGVEGDEPKLSENTDGTYTLRVPSLEVYELLSHKMELAYKFFNNSGCRGILKIDDDIKLLNKQGLSHLLNVHTSLYDYFGLSISTGCSNGLEKICIKKFSINLFKKLRIITSNFQYAGGPFYWVSSNVIKHLANDGLEYIYEDASVGYVVNNHVELTKAFIPSAFGNVVVWYNDSES